MTAIIQRRISGQMAGVLAVLFSVGVLCAADQPLKEYYSPNGKALVVIHDVSLKDDAVKRTVSVFSAEESASLAGFVSEPRHTEVYWNAESTRCAVVNAPDNGTLQLYAFSVKGKAWSVCELKPFGAVEQQFYAQFKEGQAVKPWRARVAGLKWVSETKLKISVEDGLGVHDVYETLRSAPAGKN